MLLEHLKSGSYFLLREIESTTTYSIIIYSRTRQERAKDFLLEEMLTAIALRSWSTMTCHCTQFIADVYWPNLNDKIMYVALKTDMILLLRITGHIWYNTRIFPILLALYSLYRYLWDSFLLVITATFESDFARWYRDATFNVYGYELKRIMCSVWCTVNHKQWTIFHIHP